MEELGDVDHFVDPDEGHATPLETDTILCFYQIHISYLQSFMVM